MDPIHDLTWVKHLRTGTVVERSTIGTWRLVALSLPHRDTRAPVQYLYRVLVFPEGGHKPVIALNLELSILGTACLTEQTAASHTRHQTVDQEMSYEEFRTWAFNRVRESLGEPAAATL